MKGLHIIKVFSNMLNHNFLCSHLNILIKYIAISSVKTNNTTNTIKIQVVKYRFTMTSRSQVVITVE